MEEHIARAKEQLARGSELRARSELGKSSSRGGRLTADDCNEMISLAKGITAAARGIANDARRELARTQGQVGDAACPASSASSASPPGPAAGQAVAVGAVPIAPREGSAFPLRFLWLAGLVSGVVGIGAGLYWAARRR